KRNVEGMRTGKVVFSCEKLQEMFFRCIGHAMRCVGMGYPGTNADQGPGISLRPAALMFLITSSTICVRRRGSVCTLALIKRSIRSAGSGVNRWRSVEEAVRLICLFQLPASTKHFKRGRASCRERGHV